MKTQDLIISWLLIYHLYTFILPISLILAISASHSTISFQ